MGDTPFDVHTVDRRHCAEVCIPFHGIKKDIEVLKQDDIRLDKKIDEHYLSTQAEMTRHEERANENFKAMYSKLDKILWTSIGASGVIIMFLLSIIAKLIK